ncbi:hypothetical protein F4859DRAFT_529048 [Xylaria cf. heliscus]|nr:hypothetical protein F4859DRAFT_529048 [Xylaria cf. heliscus]
MPATIESLPVELVVHIATYLDFQPVCSLRLASRTLAGKLALAHLPRFFAYKNVKLDHRSLNDFAYMTCPGRAGCGLRHCTITGAVADEPGAPDLTRLLTEAFVNLRRNSPRASLVSLRVNITDPRPRGPTPLRQDIIELFSRQALRAICHAAEQTFEITMAALHESRLSVSQHFELLGAIQGCNLSYRDAFLRITQLAPATTIFSLLKRLTMSLSSMRMPLIQIPNTIDQSIHGSNLLRGLLVIQASIPHLEELDIHWYNIGSLYSPSLENDAEDLNITTTLESPNLNLKVCSLRGLYVAGEDLLRYIKAT